MTDRKSLYGAKIVVTKRHIIIKNAHYGLLEYLTNYSTFSV